MMTDESDIEYICPIIMTTTESIKAIYGLINLLSFLYKA